MTQSFRQQNVDDVALTLARRKVGLKHGLSAPMDKLAFDLSSSLSGVGDWWKGQDPAAQKAMIGAGVGGALGLGSSFFRRRGRRHSVRDALTGALAGGAVGGGIGLLGNYKGLSEKAFPSSADEPALANKIKKLQDLSDKAQPSVLHQAGSAVAEHPILTALGAAGASDVGLGMWKADQGKNISPGAWRNVAKTLVEQATGGKDPYKTQIGNQLPAKVVDKLLSGHEPDLLALSKDKHAVKYMQKLRDIPGTYRPMTGVQYAMQQGGLPKATVSSKGKVGWGRSPRLPDWFVKAMGQQKVNPLKYAPRSLPNIPKSKAALIGVPASLIAMWLASKGFLDVSSARGQITDMREQIQRQGAK